MRLEYTYTIDKGPSARWYSYGDPFSDKVPGPLGKMLQTIFSDSNIQEVTFKYADGSKTVFRINVKDIND